MLNEDKNQAVLKDHQGRQVALTGVKVDACLRDLLAEVTVEQNYLNGQKTNIEAVYTFPLPLGAVLLGLEVEIAGKKHAGQVVEKKQAERDYEDAVTDGNSAIMLEESGPGLYTVSLGNLMAGDTAVIRYRYGLLLSWQGDRLRFLMPTTIAPRYGDAIAAGMQPHQVPESSLVVEYPLELSVRVEGHLAEAQLASPTHAVTCHRSETGMVVRLAADAVLDRDFVLTLASRQAQSTGIVTADPTVQGGHVAMAALRIPEVDGSEDKALAVKVVIDCSGSMAGISISQARKAALEIINQLRPQDRFNVTLFGDHYQHLFRTMVPATARYITEAWNRLENLDADLGGTEMEKALVATFAMDCGDAAPSVLLITDGEIHEHQKLVAKAAKSGHRVFTVGVGTAVAEVFLRNLSATTNAACELVAPQEGMTERVLTQFHRMRQPKLANLRIEWPVAPEWQSALPDNVFAGDTVHVFAGFPAEVTGDVRLKVTENAGDLQVQVPLVLTNVPEVPRIAAARRLSTASEVKALKLALDYQLLSRWTNYLVIAEREIKAEDLPELQKVPQMLAAGWGATASMDFCIPGAVACRSASKPQFLCSHKQNMKNAGIDMYDIPAFLRRQSNDVGDDITLDDAYDAQLPSSATQRMKNLGTKMLRKLHFSERSEKLMEFTEDERTPAKTGSPADFVATLERDAADVMQQPQLLRTIDQLADRGLAAEILDDLRKLVTDGHTEAEVVAAFIFALSQSDIGKCFERGFKRAIMKAWKDVVPDKEIDRALGKGLSAITEEAWNWSPVTLPATEAA